MAESGRITASICLYNFRVNVYIMFVCYDKNQYICTQKRKSMSRLYPLWNFIGHNKYWIVCIVGVLIVGFLDENSLWQHGKNRIEISRLEEQIEEYNARYERDNAKLKKLRHDPKAITKIARENYFMKADDEDIFMLSDDEKNIDENNETTE